jgi:hypothetical protein
VCLSARVCAAHVLHRFCIADAICCVQPALLPGLYPVGPVLQLGWAGLYSAGPLLQLSWAGLYSAGPCCSWAGLGCIRLRLCCSWAGLGCIRLGLCCSWAGLGCVQLGLCCSWAGLGCVQLSLCCSQQLAWAVASKPFQQVCAITIIRVWLFRCPDCCYQPCQHIKQPLHCISDCAGACALQGNWVVSGLRPIITGCAVSIHLFLCASQGSTIG